MFTQERLLENGLPLRSYIRDRDGTLNIPGCTQRISFGFGQAKLSPKQTCLGNKHTECIKKSISGQFNELIIHAERTLGQDVQQTLFL